MSRGLLGRHGRDHRPGGSDPIPGLTIGGGGEAGYAPSIQLPVLELAYEANNIEASMTPTWTIDSGYAMNGYMQLSGDGSYIAWPTVLGPQGSQWLAIPVLASGPDFGIVKFEVGTAEYEDDGNGWPGTFEAYSDVGTFVTIQSTDRYAASLDKFPGHSLICTQFQIAGADGAITTSFNGTQINGGSGPHWVRLRVDGKNASSSGFKMQISAFNILRLGNDLTA